MMEFLVKATDNTNSNPEKDRQGCFKQGYPISIKANGWYGAGEHWHQSGYAKHIGTRLCVIKCPDITKEQTENYVASWMKEIDYEMLSSNPTNGSYQIRVFGKNVSTTGQNRLTKDQIEKYITGWKCTVDSFATNEVTFTLKLWAVVRSERFWTNDTVMVGFDFISYNQNTGVGVIDADVSNTPWVNKIKGVESIIRKRGGTVIGWTNSTVRFSIEKSIVLGKFKEDVKTRIETLYCVRQFYFDASDVDTALSQGGVVTLTKTQLLNSINNKLDE